MFCPVGYNQMCDGICPDHGACRGKPETERDMGDIAARPQEILAGLPRSDQCPACGVLGGTHLQHCAYYACEWCHMPKGQHATNCSILKQEKEKEMEADTAQRINHLLENPIVYQLSEVDLKRYCDNARAYGWEAGRQAHGKSGLRRVYESTPGNPFISPDWDEGLKGEGFLLTSRENQL